MRKKIKLNQFPRDVFLGRSKDQLLLRKWNSFCSARTKLRPISERFLKIINCIVSQNDKCLSINMEKRAWISWPIWGGDRRLETELNWWPFLCCCKSNSRRKPCCYLFLSVEFFYQFWKVVCHCLTRAGGPKSTCIFWPNLTRQLSNSFFTHTWVHYVQQRNATQSAETNL